MDRHAADREKIVHPALQEAFDRDWYYPWSPDQWPKADRKHPLVQKAIDEGWGEWIECQADLEAVKQGYVFDVSRDKRGRPVYWHGGSWVRWQGKGNRRRLIKIPAEKAAEEIKYVGRGDHFCRFAESFFFHTKQPLEGSPYRLLYWQRKACLCIFGWIRHTKDASRRPVRYRRHLRAWIEVSKKNGKSELGSIVAIYLVRADYTLKSRVYGTAVEKKQARIVFDEARDFVKASPTLDADLFIHDSRTDAKISHFESGSSYEVVSADADSNDGPDAHGVIFDEIHRQKNRRLYATLQRSGQSRPQPLEFVTTTYGDTLKSIWGELHLKAKMQLQDRSMAIDCFVMIASAEPFQVELVEVAEVGAKLLQVRRLEHPIDVGEEIEFESSDGGPNVTVTLTKPAKRFQRFLEVEPVENRIARYSEGTCNENPLDPDRVDHAIYRANPSVDITTPHDRIKALILGAISPNEQAEAKRFNLNILAGSGNLWLSGAAWMACGRKRIVNSKLLKQRCFGGLDLSTSNDLTAFWLAFPNWPRNIPFGKVTTPRIDLLGIVWVNGEGIEEREKSEEIPYRALSQPGYFGEFGYVRICDGETIDYGMVGQDIIKLCSFFRVEAIAYDSHKAQFVVEPYLEKAGLNCIVHQQGAISMSPPSQRFENLVKHHQISHGNHPLLDAAVEGCVLREADDVSNRYPSKKKSLSRIDPLVAAIMATGWSCSPPKGIESGAWTGDGTGIW